MLAPNRHISWSSDPQPASPTVQPGFSALGDDFVVSVAPTPLPAPYLVALSDCAADLLAWSKDHWTSPAGIQQLAGNTWPSEVRPFASVYSGHQFGVWAGQLGDGRAIHWGTADGWEVQLKGCGRTPFSRMGDGRAVLRSSIREFLASEAMVALGVPTTRALAVVGSDQPVYRESVETAAVVTRLAPSFVRFGHFEHFCHHGLHSQLRTLADYVIDQFYPQCREAETSPYAALLAEVAQRTAHMVAQWQSLGFCHGVMNTDNMSILGLTLDYGPFQFMDAYDPMHRCNHSDHQGRYAFARQVAVTYWNLACLAQSLVPLVPDTAALVTSLDGFKLHVERSYRAVMAAKLGWSVPWTSPDDDTALRDPACIDKLLGLLAQHGVDHTIFWRRLSHWSRECDLADTRVADLFVDREAAATWLQTYADTLPRDQREQRSHAMLQVNPKFVLRNHLAELAIRDAQQGDYHLTHELQRVLASPFDEHHDHEDWADLPPDWSRSIAISCSS